MKLSTSVYLFSALSGSALATSITAFTQEGCGAGAYATCNNIPSNTCCVIENTNTGTGASSGQFNSLPGGSNRVLGFQATRSSSGGIPCGSAVSNHVTGASSACISFDPSSGEYAGLAWLAGSSSRRRSVGADAGISCTRQQRPDEIGFVDGSKFCLQDMSDEVVRELWELAHTTDSSEGFPDKFHKHKC